jgi:hypothetical protein
MQRDEEARRLDAPARQSDRPVEVDEAASGDSIPYPSGYSDNPNAHFGSRFFISREP